MIKELYFWIYQSVRKFKTNDRPAISAIGIVSILQGANIGSIQVVLDYIFKFGNVEKNATIYWGLIISFIVFITNYFYLYKNRDDIFRKYEKLTPKRRRKGILFSWLYALGSLFLFFFLVANLVTPKYK